MRAMIRSGLVAGLVLGASAARACPLCASDTGRKVRENILGPSFGFNLAATLLPFAVFLGVAAIIHYGGDASAPETGDRAGVGGES